MERKFYKNFEEELQRLQTLTKRMFMKPIEITAMVKEVWKSTMQEME